jgi:acyl carrier protein
MKEEDILKKVALAISRANKDIQPELIRAEASLVEDLGFDSMRLAALFSDIKANFGIKDMTAWYVSAARDGADTVHGLVTFLASSRASDARGRRAADSRTEGMQ